MIKRKLSTLVALLLACIMLIPATAFAYASDGGDASEPADEPAYTAADESGEDDTLPFNTDMLTTLLSGMDSELAQVLKEHPRLIAMFMPTLHVTVKGNTVTITIDKDKTGENDQTGIVATGGARLNVRTGAGIGNDIITQLINGTEVKVLGEKDGWYQIELPERYGYVCGEYLRINDVPVSSTDDGYSFDITGDMILSFLSLFEDLMQTEEQPSHGLTPSGNLTLVDDLGTRNGTGQQFITLVSKNGNYFYLIIDRDEKGEETVHFLNMVDERDLFALMEEDEAAAYQKQQAEEQAAKEAAEKAAAEAAAKASETENPKEEDKQVKKTNLAPVLIVIVVMAAAGGGWFFMQTRKKKKAESALDPDIDYEDDDEDYGAGDDTADDYDGDPYEDEGDLEDESEDLADDAGEDE